MNVKGIVIVNPGNPTGSMINKESLKRIIKFGIENKLVIICDEVFY